MNNSIQTEWAAHIGGGYRKYLYVNVNVISKEVNFTVVDRMGGTEKVFDTLEGAQLEYDLIPRR